MSVDSEAFVLEFSNLVDEEPGAIFLETRLAELENWDSLNVLMLITHVDETYGVELPLQELSECDTISDVFALVESSLNPAHSR